MTPQYFGEVQHPKRPVYFDGAPKADWRQHEKDVAKRSGDRRVRGSGNQPGRPGDAIGGRFLREAKAVSGASLSIRAAWLRKLSEQALCMNKTPLFEIRLEGVEVPVPRDWILLPADAFQEIVDGSARHHK